MYNLPYYKESDQELIRQFVRDHPFAFIAGSDASGKPVATQIPVFIDENEGKFYLTGHIMKKMDHHNAFEENSHVLAVFTGPHCYVSATWYSDPYQASTWNYMSVHARGTIRFGDEQDLIAILKRLTLYYEKGNAGSTTVFDNLPPEYTARLMKAIVPFEIEVESFEHIFKLSQDRDEKSYDNIVSQLKQQQGDGKIIGEIMEKRKSKVFPG